MDKQRRVIALGFFDGVHLGHAALLRKVKETADRLGAVPCAFTFDKSPAAALTGREIPLLTGVADRSDLMNRLFGIRQVLVAGVNRQMMQMPWEKFVEDYLVGAHGAVHLVAGHDFRFGYRGEGDPDLLRAKCARLGLGCDIIPKVELDGVTVSSTYIRTLIAQGKMEEAVRFLGHPHVLTGRVRHGKRLGSRLGFPTVNLAIPEGVIAPAFGVYAVKLWVQPVCPDNHEPPGPRRLPEEGPYLAVANVGVRPTVDRDGGVTVEPWILDFDGDLYDRTVRVEFHARLRPERRFPSVEELRAEVLRNAEQAREYFAKESPLPR